MWLEETAWMWLPLVCVIAGGVAWRLIALAREVRRLHARINALEVATTSSEGELPRVDERAA